MLGSPCSATEVRVYKEEPEDSQSRSGTEIEEATVTQLTTVRDRYHGWTVVVARTKFLLPSCSTGITSYGHEGSKYTQMKV